MVRPLPPINALNDSKGQTTTHDYRWRESLGKSVSQVETLLDNPATADQFRSNASGVLLSPASIWDAAAAVALTDAATIAIDLATGFNFSVTIAGNRTLGNPTNIKVGQSGCIVVTASGATRTINKGGNWKSTGITWPVSIPSGQKAYIFYWCDPTVTNGVLATSVLLNPA